MKNVYRTTIKRRKRNILGRTQRWNTTSIFFTTLISIVIISAIFVSTKSNEYAKSLPTKSALLAEVSTPSTNSTLYDRNGNLLYIFTDPNQDRDYVSINNMSIGIKWAVLASEDKNFYSHGGVDYIALCRSLIRLITSGGNVVTGASTITQQLVKNTVLTNERTFKRKIKEILVSFMLEQNYSKDQILELYLNSASFGGRLKGIGSAARTYFDKTPDKLTLEESVFLTSLIQSPGISSPLFSGDSDHAWDIIRARMHYVYGQLIEIYPSIISREPTFYSLEAIQASRAHGVSLNPNLGHIDAPHFVFFVKNYLNQPKIGISDEMLYTKGYTIISTLDLRIQKIAEGALKAGIDKYSQYEMNNGAFVVIDPTNGDLLAMAGSKDYFADRDPNGKFDPQVNAAISPHNLGSTLKPFLVYLAFKDKLYYPYSIVYDKPINIRGYKPKNYDGKFYGAMSVTRALQISRNTPFVQILDRVGVPKFIDLLDQIGYVSAAQGDSYGPSVAIGGFESNLLEHTLAYSILANGGSKNNLRIINLLSDRSNDIIYSEEAKSESLLDPKYVAQVNKILDYYGPPGIAGKTGTTDENRDTFFIGYNDKLVAGIWIGNNNNERMSDKAFGSTTALPIWNIFYEKLIQEMPEYGSVKK